MYHILKSNCSGIRMQIFEKKAPKTHKIHLVPPKHYPSIKATLNLDDAYVIYHSVCWYVIKSNLMWNFIVLNLQQLTDSKVHNKT